MVTTLQVAHSPTRRLVPPACGAPLPETAPHDWPPSPPRAGRPHLASAAVIRPGAAGPASGHDPDGRPEGPGRRQPPVRHSAVRGVPPEVRQPPAGQPGALSARGGLSRLARAEL